MSTKWVLDGTYWLNEHWMKECRWNEQFDLKLYEKICKKMNI